WSGVGWPSTWVTSTASVDPAPDSDSRAAQRASRAAQPVWPAGDTGLTGTADFVAAPPPLCWATERLRSTKADHFAKPPDPGARRLGPDSPPPSAEPGSSPPGRRRYPRPSGFAPTALSGIRALSGRTALRATTSAKYRPLSFTVRRWVSKSTCTSP